MNQGDLFNIALTRPQGFGKLSCEEQWRIDKELGLLDWDGSCSHSTGYPCEECEKKYFEAQGKPAYLKPKKRI